MVIRRAYSLKDETFGNGRYINSLLSEEILQNMARRVSKLPSPTIEQLITIEKKTFQESDKVIIKSLWRN